MPLDEFHVGSPRLDNYAEQLLQQQCLEDAGYAWPVPWQDIDELAVDEAWNVAGRRLFSEGIASEWGYRTPREQSESARLWAEFLVAARPIAQTQGFDEASTGCLEDARLRYPIIGFDDTLFVSGLASQAAADADLDPTVAEAAALWKACLEPIGVGAIPDNPDNMPTEDIAASLGLPRPAHGDEPRPEDDDDTPSAREIEVAVADARCADESGYTQAKYDAEWELQETLVEQNRTELDRIRENVQARRADVFQIIANHAPRAP